ncbi:uncharacterized protein TM35_000132640 [Trypanosoma theileri]|uniref:Uncharacterized protein n=1 Tax=Trypanosoma theileri TaxID=67003 RepID=A0A1X0NYM8_9TRYP|nr:uncharacterized protein TM35_000132640 [Trypanosoma theileri]ORC89260.1 hypothetical protein TM35_000132640 [Trypanosoma theileri]
MIRLLFCLVFAVFFSEVSQASTPYIYDGGFEFLRVGEMRFNETMEFPSDMLTEVRRRYILAGLQRDRRYLVHLSFLGSPSIDYRIHVGHQHRSLVEMHQEQAKEETVETYHPQGQRKLADVNMLHFRTHIDDLGFDFIGGDGAVDIGDMDIKEIGVGEKNNDNDYIPLLEIRGRRNAFPPHPEMWEIFSYNLRIDAIGNFEGVTLTVIAHFIMIVVSVISSTLLVSRLITLIAGDAPKPQARRDFLIFFWNFKEKSK